MIYRKFGKTGFDVSAIGMGGYQFTNEFNVPLAEADSILDYALTHGINLYDTAQLYGFGESEALIGRAFRRNPEAASKSLITTKIGYLDAGVVRINGEAAYTDPEKLARTLKHSLWLLQRDAFDIVLLHEIDKPHWKFDYDTCSCPAYDFLMDCKKEGLIKYIGVSSWDLDAMARTVKTDKVDVVMCAGGISLLYRPVVTELLPVIKEHNVAFELGGAFGQNNPGLVSKDREKMKEHYYADGDEDMIAIGNKLEKLYDIADELDCSMVELAIRYVMSYEDIQTHIPGARALWQLEANLASAEKGPLPQEIVDRIEKIQDMSQTESTLQMVRREKRMAKEKAEAAKKN